MKTIGFLGETTWEASVEYYRLIRELIKAPLVSTGEITLL